MVVKYFDELENLDNYKVYIMPYNSVKHINRKVSIEMYQKYHYLFKKINEINNILELKMIVETHNIKNEKEQYLRKIKIIELIKEKYVLKEKNNYETSQDLYNLFINDKYKNVLTLLRRIDSLSTKELKSILFFYKVFFGTVNLDKNNDILLAIDSFFKDINANDTIIYENEYKPLILPNYWYILPKLYNLEERLYNTTGENGHKEANLLYPYYKALDGVLIDYRLFINKIKEIEKDGVSKEDYLSFVRYGMGYFPDLINDNNNTFEVKSHIKNNILITTGCIMAQCLLWKYFGDLKEKSNDYQKNLEILKNVTLDDFLVRFVGFHKILMMNGKRIISTSNINYQEDFSEYIRNGWDIDFTKPLVFNHSKNTVEEIDDDIVKVKYFHGSY